MTKFVIEDSVPVPTSGYQKDGFYSTLRRLKVGQSFEFDWNRKCHPAKSLSSISQKYNARYAARKISEGRYRVWRVA